MAQSLACVWYIELKGEGAVEALTLVLHDLPNSPGFLGAELLVSPAQPGLALLASRWNEEPPSIPLPQQAKHWSFQVIAAAVP